VCGHHCVPFSDQVPMFVGHEVLLIDHWPLSMVTND